MEGVWYGVAHQGEKIFATTFASSEKRALQGLLRSIPFNVQFQHSKEASAFAGRVLKALKNVYEGKSVSQNFSLVTEHLSSYTRIILEITRRIPLGYVSSYGAIAKAVGGSPRAVGGVMASNPFAPIVPCHRVVSSDFTLGGYGGGYGEGLKVKLAFLKREKQGYTSNREISVNDKKLQVFPVELVLKRVEKGKC